MSPPERRVEHLGRDVVHRAQHRPIGDRSCARRRAGQIPGRRAWRDRLRRDDDVAGLDVAVHPAGLVQGVERLGHLPGDPECHRQVELPVGPQLRGQRAAFEKRHGQVVRRLARARAARIGTRCGCVTCAADVRLAGQDRQPARIVLPLRPQDFDARSWPAGRPDCRRVGPGRRWPTALRR